MKYFVYILILVLGFLIGSTCGEILRLLLPIRYAGFQIFTQGYLAGFAPVDIELKIAHIDFGIKVLVNFFSWVGLFVASLSVLIKELTSKQ
ncbi:MAG TPA: hypothetical protein PLB98_06765 [bacterium]|jgi:hypothetical protein|nr:hypothetical protein [bacterium]